jgi:hypothetical protein
MGFPKKKTTPAAIFTQENVATLAAEALRKSREMRVRLALRLTAETPILVQRWTSKAVRKMLGAMVGMPVPKEPKDLTSDYEESWYRNEDGKPVIPCRVIKAAIVEGAIATGGVVTKADLKRGLRVLGYTTPLLNAEKSMDIKIVRNSTGGPDVRARASFEAGCYMDVVLEFGLPLTPDMVISAVDAAGCCIGLCEWRPERGGDLGTFKVEVLPSNDATINKILKSCSSPEDEFVLPPEMLKAFQNIPTERLNDGGRKVRALIEHQDSTRGRKAS